MKSSDVEKMLNTTKQEVYNKIFIPSAGRDLLFHNISTGSAKTLARLGLYSTFDLDNEILKLNLFDNLLVEGQGDVPAADNLLQIDYLSFIIGIRKMLKNDLSFNCTCQNCDKQFTDKVNLDSHFSQLIYEFKPENYFFEKIDENDRIWRFELSNYNMRNYLYFRYMVETLKEYDPQNPDLTNENKFIKPILYIKNIWIDEEPIEDWGDKILTNKLKFFNSIPASITINNLSNEMYLSKFIEEHFIEERLQSAIDDLKVVCPYCKETYNNVYTFEDFFTF